MAQTKSHKRYKTNKKVQSAKIKAQKFGQTKKREEAIKTEKLMKEDFVDEEQEQEQHEQSMASLVAQAFYIFQNTWNWRTRYQKNRLLPNSMFLKMLQQFLQ